MFRGGFVRCPRDGDALVHLDVDPLIGSVLAKTYLIEALLGEGGLGRVYRARHVKMSRRYAIKVPFDELATSAKLRLRFANEAEAASRLSHPNVIAVVDVGETPEGLLYMAMDLADGLPLSVSMGKPMAGARVLTLVEQMADGLSHAHERGLVHRDLKPDNVMLGRDELGADRIAIVDFGIALVREAMESGPRLTTEGLVLGTPAYMAPEQATGSAIDHRADLFALGLIMYELLAGVQPFEGSPIEVLRRNAITTPPRINERVLGLAVDPLLEALVFWLIEKRADERPQSAAAVAGVVRMIVADRRAARARLAPWVAADAPVEPDAATVQLDDVEDVEGAARVAVVSAPVAAQRPAAVRRQRIAIAAAAVVAVMAVMVFVWQQVTAPEPASVAVAEAETGAEAVAEPVTETATATESGTETATESETGAESGTETGTVAVAVAVAVKGKRSGSARTGGKKPVALEAVEKAAALPSERSLTALYRDVGATLKAMVKDRGAGDPAVVRARERYAAIPYLEAIREPGKRADAIRQLRALARDLAKRQ